MNALPLLYNHILATQASKGLWVACTPSQFYFFQPTEWKDIVLQENNIHQPDASPKAEMNTIRSDEEKF